MTEKIFCLAPWSNLEILPSGEILPCCKFQMSPYDRQYNITNNTIKEYRNSEILAEIKQDFLKGQWPRGCQRCQIEEQNNIKSKRQLDRERWSSEYDTYDLNQGNLLTLSLAMGNVCNLKCIMCGPHASSLWQKEFKDIYGIQYQNIEYYRKNTINDIINWAPDLIHIDIHGGEPFLSSKDEHMNLLDHYIQTKKSQNISLHYTTNGTLWPDLQWTNRWKHFKEIDLQISIDGLGEQYEYIRYPASWSTLLENIKKYQEYQLTNSNFKISIAHTVSAFNIMYIPEFLDWCKSLDLPEPWMGKLHRPDHLRPSVWPHTAKQSIIKTLELSNNVLAHNWANLLRTTDDSCCFDKFVNFVKLHDQYRKLDFCQTFPELANFFLDSKSNMLVDASKNI